MKKLSICVVCMMLVMSMSSCGEKNSQETTTTTVITEVTSDISRKDTKESTTEESNEASENDKVASGDETIAPQDIVSEDMTPVTADMVKEGEYDINVDSSSSMFKVTACHLTVLNGKMTAVITMSGTAYEKMFMGTGNEAVSASEEQYIKYQEDAEGKYTFQLPVSALDSGITCCAYSKNKEKWYDRVLVFRADSLPLDAISGMISTAEQLKLEDGVYSVEVALEGGSGKASVQSPTEIKVTDGLVTATIIFSSKNYDYMIVDGTKYERINEEGNSTFEIPVAGFDCKLPVIADTTAMSQPYEIEYTLRFDSKTIQ